MEDFYLLQPSPLLAEYVRHYWVLKTIGDASALVRTVPTGMMSLFFTWETSFFRYTITRYIPGCFSAGRSVRLLI